MNQIKKEANRKYFIYAIFIAAIFCIHLPMKYFNDDLLLFSSVGNTSLPEFFLSRLNHIGKIFTDVLADLFLRLPMAVWKIVDTIVYFLIARLIARIFTEDTWKDALLVCVLIVLFPFWYLSTAGWVITATNYLYPTLGLLLVANFLNGIRMGKSVHALECILTVCAIIYTTNQDQAAMVLLGGLFLYLCYAIITKADPRLIHWIAAAFAFSLISYAILFFLPGHINRMTSTVEMDLWLPQYANWSLFQKLYHGYTATVANLFFHNVKLFDLFCLLIFLLSIYQPCMIKKLIGSIPLAAILGIHLIGQGKFVIYPSYAGGMPELIPLSSGWKGIAVLLLTVLVIGCMIFTICGCVHKRENKWLILMLLVLAAGSREMMGLSATLYASHARTFTYFIYALILCNIILLNEIKRQWKSGWFVGLGAAIAMLLYIVSPFYYQQLIL